ncbi:MAG: TetR/AcrR family transcriptional regulator [Paludibacteraceae bacterium]
MAESFSKTKKKLIDVARELFAVKGKREVTMNDIAESSNKGRRTLYTYFKNKEEVYEAVIENELYNIIESLRQVSQKDIDPYDKLKEHIIVHLDTMKKAVTRNGTLRADFFRDISEVERTRKKIDKAELELIKGILREGVKTEEFRNMNVEIISIIILYALKGLEIPYIKQNISEEFRNNADDILEFVFKGIKLRELDEKK